MIVVDFKSEDQVNRYKWAYEEAQQDIEVLARCLAKYAPPEAIHEALAKVSTARAEKTLTHALTLVRHGDLVECLDLPPRICNALKRAELYTIDDIRNHLKAFSGRFNIRNFGVISQKELFEAMLKKGYEIPIDTP